ncbi:MAG: hypothetical protein DI539_18705 [Flavobacterium psychrophilum]|nr:MAG: hypothetical protein DI539_18705 [Flavobacterium psychrophilum]
MPLAVGKRYLKEAILLNNNRNTKIHALCLANEAEGHEIRNKVIQASIGAKGISFIRGTVVPAQEAHVFEGFMDFLSAVVIRGKVFEGDVIILNSAACLPQAFPYLREYTYKKLHSWLDNDNAGMSATKTLKEFADAQGYEFEARNDLYAPYKDVNKWHTETLKTGKKPTFN